MKVMQITFNKEESMRKIIVISFVILTLLLLSGCLEKVSVTEENEQLDVDTDSMAISEDMPDIVFIYSQEYNYEYFTSYVFDKTGNIYYSDKEEIYYLHSDELLELCSSGKLGNRMTLLGTIETSELNKYFQLFLEIMKDGGVTLTSDNWVVDEIMPHDTWHGLYSDKMGNIELTLLSKEDNGNYHTNDPRADEIVEWMKQIVDKYKPSSS